MTPAELPAWMGLSLIAQLGGAVVGLAGVVAVAVFFFRGRAVPAALAPLWIGAPAWVAVAFALIGAAQIAPDGGEAAVRGAAAAFGGRLFMALTLAPLALAFTWIAAVHGLRQSPKRPAVAGLAALGVLGAMAAPWGYAIPQDDWMFAGFRTGLYAAVGLPTVLALLGGDEEGPGPLVGASAAGLFALVVSAGEAAQRGLMLLVMAKFLDGENVTLEKVDPYIDGAWAESVALYAPWDVVAVACGVAVGLVGALSVRGEGRAALGWSGVVTAILAGAVFWLGALDPDAMKAFGRAVVSL